MALTMEKDKMETRLGQCESGIKLMLYRATRFEDKSKDPDDCFGRIATRLLERAVVLDERLKLSKWDSRLLDSVWGELATKGYIKGE